MQTNFYNQTAERDQSFYAQEQVLTLNQRLSLTAGVTAERTTNDGAIDKLYAYPKYAVAYRIPAVRRFHRRDQAPGRARVVRHGADLRRPIQPAEQHDRGWSPGRDDRHGRGRSQCQARVGESRSRPDSTRRSSSSRAQLSFTVYQKRISNLLLEAALSASRGYDMQWLNGGEFTNQGAELSLSATPVQLRNGFTWVSTTSFYRNYSVMNALPSQVAPFNGIYPGRSVSEDVNDNFTSSNGYPDAVSAISSPPLL